MTENIKPNFDADMVQLKALMKVINEISGQRVPFKRVEDLPKQPNVITSKTIRALREHISDYTFDDGDLVQDLKSAIVELQYLSSIIEDLRERLNERDSEVNRLERLVHNAN